MKKDGKPMVNVPEGSSPLLNRDKNLIIFDLGGVLLNVQWIDKNQEFLGLCDAGQDAVAAFFEGSEWDALERGKISFEDFFETLEAGVGFRGTDQDLKKAITNYSLNIPMFGFLQRLKQGKWMENSYNEIVILSNISEVAFLGAMKQWPGLFYSFSERFLSYKLEMRKPEVEIFQHVCKDRGVPPKRALLVDDNKENCKAAESIEIKSHVFEDDVEMLSGWLRQFKVDTPPTPA